MKKILRDNSVFLVPYIVILAAVFPYFILYSKSDIHLWLNGHNSTYADKIFPVITFLGDGLFVCAAAMVLLFVSFKSAMQVFSSYLLSGFFVQLLKRTAFHSSLRPSAFFEGKADLHLIKGVELLGSKSFPSGHSASAFALFLSVAMLTGSRPLKIICLIMAVLVAYSRVYLSQHFLCDIYAGSVIGVSCAVVIYWFMSKREKHWYDLSPFSLSRSKRENIIS
jgi:membrane-associated phospholipid phosphatase